MEKLLTRVVAAAACAWCAAGGLAVAQDEAAEAPAAVAAGGAASADEKAIHDELRQLREELTKAVADGDVAAQLTHADERIVTTWQNGQVAVGRDGLESFLKEMDGGAGRVFQGYKSPPAADQRATIYGGDTAIAIGSSVPHYKYLGLEFDLENRWTATLVKEGGQWKVAAYHVSTNVLDNPLLAAAKKSMYWAGGVGLLVGVIVGTLLSRMKAKGRQPVV